jgi:hypothetical protein
MNWIAAKHPCFEKELEDLKQAQALDRHLSKSKEAVVVSSKR